MPDHERTIQQLKDQVQRFVDQRDWRTYHDPKNLAMSIAIEAAELMEHFQWWRSDELAAVRDDPQAMAEIREELADIACYVLSFANALGIDLSSAVESKLAKNAEKYPADRFRGKFRAEGTGGQDPQGLSGKETGTGSSW